MYSIKIKIENTLPDFTSVKQKQSYIIRLTNQPETIFSEISPKVRLIYHHFVSTSKTDVSRFANQLSKCYSQFFEIITFYYKQLQSKLFDYSQYYYKMPEVIKTIDSLFQKIKINKDYQTAYYYTNILIEIFYTLKSLLNILISLEFNEFKTYQFHLKGISENLSHILKNSNHLFENDSLNFYCINTK
ncbi:hypothetical protein SDC9_01496 [bioreactor metagenome]|uniref:Uncharacterized protein n=1 Tax=bioreactor metagenome TaxID=1076179 RepID=A0A644SMW2_9ZZZZ